MPAVSDAELRIPGRFWVACPSSAWGCLFAPKVPANKSEELRRLVHSLRVQGLLVQAIYVARLVRETGGPLLP